MAAKAVANSIFLITSLPKFRMDRKFPGSLTGQGGVSSSRPCRKGSAAKKASYSQMPVPQATLKDANRLVMARLVHAPCSQCYFLWQTSVFGVFERGI